MKDKFIKMKILQISPVAPPQRSGMSNAAGQIAAATAFAGADVTLSSAIGGGQIVGVTIPHIKSYRVPGAGFLAFTPKLVGLMRQADIVHLHYPCFGNAALVNWARKWKVKKPLVVSYHMDVAGRGLRWPIFAWHQKFCAPAFLRQAEKIVVASADYAKHSLLAKYPELAAKVVEIPFGIDTQRFTPHRPAGIIGAPLILARHGIRDDEPVVLFVGGLDEQHYFKGLHVLMEAIKSVPTAILMVVGSGSLLNAYVRRANELGIGERVVFAGKISDAELPDYYRAAQVLALPSIDRSEAYGLVLTEAAATGLPAIASSLPGVRTVVLDGETGLLVRPGDVTALTQAIKKILSNGELRAKFGQAARVLAESLSWQLCGERYVKLYREILGD